VRQGTDAVPLLATNPADGQGNFRFSPILQNPDRLTEINTLGYPPQGSQITMRITIIRMICFLEPPMKRTFAAILLSTFAVSAALAADDVITLTIENHTFSPKEVKVPAGKKIQLKVINKDATPAEFESKPLSREKIIAGKSSAIVRIGPLKAGRYDFVEEFHEKEAGAQGTIVVE
jgi:plastocyanin